MAPNALNPSVRRLCAATTPHDRRTDRQLLDDYLTRRDQAAFAALVRRHRRFVLAACRQVLSDPADIDDAFQSTFLVLLRKARSVRWAASLGSWLFAVAHRVAVEARTRSRRRQLREGAAAARAEAAVEPPDLSWREACAILHEELDRLPDRYRLPLLLCYLDGQSRDEAARQLGWTAGAVKGRLERGRGVLRRKLERRGVTLAAGLLAALAGPEAAAQSTGLIKKATLFAVTLAVGVVAAVAGLRPTPPPPAAPEQPPVAAEAPAPEVPEVVKGVVLGPDGKPCPGATVYAGAALFDAAVPVVVATAGADGRFEARPPSTWRKPDQPWLLVARAEGFGIDWLDARSANGGEVTLRLPEDLPVEGRLIDPEGRPVAGATVRVWSLATTAREDIDPILAYWKREAHLAPFQGDKRLDDLLPPALAFAHTGPDGRFRLAGVGRERLAGLSVTGPGIAAANLLVVGRRGIDLASLNLAVRRQAAVPGEPSDPELVGPSFAYVVAPSKLVEGVVRDADSGAPVAYVSVTSSAGHSAAEMMTGADGRFRLVGLLKQPHYDVLATPPPGLGHLSAGVHVADTPGLEPVRVELRLCRGTVVRGRLTDAVTGKPVAGSVRHAPLADNRFFDSGPGTNGYGFERYDAPTDADGKFTLTVLPGPGVLMALAQGPGYLAPKVSAADRDRLGLTGRDLQFTAAGNSVEWLGGSCAYRIIEPAADARTLDCELTATRGRDRTVRVTDPDGKLLAGVIVAGITDRSPARLGPLKEASFTALGLDPDRPRTLMAFHPGRSLGAVLALRGNEDAPVLQLQPCAALAGRLLDADGRPLAGVEVSPGFDDRDAREFERRIRPDAWPVRTGADGRFRLTGLVPGLKVGLYLRHEGQGLTASPRIGWKTPAAGEVIDVGDRTAGPE